MGAFFGSFAGGHFGRRMSFSRAVIFHRFAAECKENRVRFCDLSPRVNQCKLAGKTPPNLSSMPAEINERPRTAQDEIDPSGASLFTGW